MKTLIIGGTGLISTGIVKHLIERGAEITVFNRGQSPSTLPKGVKTLIGNRNEAVEFAKVFTDTRYDVVIDMICFSPAQATAAIAAAQGRCDHFIFCSTVCTYGIKSPANIFVDESFLQEPISEYGKNKLACEKLFLQAHANKKMNCTIIRPSHTYGPGHPLIDNLEPDTVAWDRISNDKPVLCSGDGLGFWVSTHRDDCGKLFAYAAMNPKTFGQAYNATRVAHTTWRDYYKQVARVLGKTANLVFMPTDWIVRQDPKRFNLLKEITAFHGAYDSSKAAADVPQFVCEIDLIHGAAEVFSDQKSRNAWKDSDGDAIYDSAIEQAMNLGMKPVAA